MPRWLMVSVRDGGQSQVWMEGTDPVTLEWLLSEVRRRDPQCKIKQTDKDADGVVYQLALELSRGQHPALMLPALKRLLCDQGWEPYIGGFKRQA